MAGRAGETKLGPGYGCAQLTVAGRDDGGTSDSHNGRWLGRAEARVHTTDGGWAGRVAGFAQPTVAAHDDGAVADGGRDVQLTVAAREETFRGPRLRIRTTDGDRRGDGTVDEDGDPTDGGHEQDLFGLDRASQTAGTGHLRRR